MTIALKAFCILQLSTGMIIAYIATETLEIIAEKHVRKLWNAEQVNA